MRSVLLPDRFYINSRSGLARYNPLSPDVQPGHGPASPALYLDSEEFLREDLREKYQHPRYGLSGEELEAAIEARVRYLIPKRRSLDDASFKGEQDRTPETVTTYEWKMDERDGQYHLYEPNNEFYLIDMLRNTERHMKRLGRGHLYNNEETRAILAIEQALLHGEAQSGLYPTSDESGTVRYMTNMVIVGNKIETRYIDVGLVGDDLTPLEATTVIDKIQSRHHFTVVQPSEQIGYRFLLLKDDAVSTRELWNVAESKVLMREEPTPKVLITSPGQADRVVLPDADGAYPSRSMLRDDYPMETGDFAFMGNLQIAELLHDRKNKIIVSVIGNDTYESPELLSDEVSSAADRIVEIGKSADVPDSDSEHGTRQEPILYQLQSSEVRKFEPHTTHKPKRQELSTREVFSETLKQRLKAARSLSFVTETGIGLGAVPLLLTQLSQEFSKPVRAVEKSIARHEKKKAKKRKEKKILLVRKERKKGVPRLKTNEVVFVSSVKENGSKEMKRIRRKERIRKKKRAAPYEKGKLVRSPENRRLRVKLASEKKVAIALIYIIKKTQIGAGILPFLVDILLQTDKSKKRTRVRTLGFTNVTEKKKNKKLSERLRQKKKKVLHGMHERIVLRKKKKEKNNRIHKEKEARRLLAKERKFAVRKITKDMLIRALVKTLTRLDAVEHKAKKKIMQIYDITPGKVVFKELQLATMRKEIEYRYISALLFWILLRLQEMEQRVSTEMKPEKESQTHYWLLLAIIWYLSHLSEGRVPVRVKQKKTKKKKPALPLSGIIFHPAAHYV